jgi:glycerol-3-phosphate dehydrogenase
MFKEFFLHENGGDLKMNFSNINRKDILSKLKSKNHDVLIIGGGITGAGIALDAASRGMKTALVEMQDFSSGTSSRSTKLVHGGLRYLKQFEIKMVADVGKERAIVYENGPHVTTPERMLLPIYRGGTFGKYSTAIGLSLYDFLAGVKKGERKVMLSKENTLKLEPLIKNEGLMGGGYYVEYRTDDSRLTMEVIKAAFDQGALALNYTKVNDLKYDENGKIIGVLVVDQLTGESFEILATRIVNATGPWVDSIRDLDKSKSEKGLKLSKGVHIVIDQSRFPLKQAVYFDTPDGRMIFAIPRDGKAYVGTTDTFYEDDTAHPSITVSDHVYILNAINYMFPTVKITEQDIESSWSGVRPLIYEEGKNSSEISRKDEIWESDSGLITIAGGKLTGYRKMAETIVDLLADKLSKSSKKKFQPCKTKQLPISGGNVGGAQNFLSYISKQVEKGQSLGLEKSEVTHLANIYGSNIPRLFELIPSSNIYANKYSVPQHLALKLLYAVHFEMAATPVDYFFRRTGELLFDIETVKKYKNEAVLIMRDLLQWDERLANYYLAELEKEVRRATVPIDLK